MSEPTTAAGRALMDELIDPVMEMGGWYEAAMRQHVIAIEAEARQQDGSALRIEVAERVIATIENAIEDQAPEWLEAAFADAIESERALAALPPSAPPALDEELLRGWLRDNDDGLTEQDSADLVKRTRARLQEQDR